MNTERAKTIILKEEGVYVETDAILTIFQKIKDNRIKTEYPISLSDENTQRAKDLYNNQNECIGAIAVDAALLGEILQEVNKGFIWVEIHNSPFDIDGTPIKVMSIQASGKAYLLTQTSGAIDEKILPWLNYEE